MRYHEFASQPPRRDITETDIADTARKAADRQVKLRKKLADAQSQRSDAARQYADKMRVANEKQRDAQQSLSRPTGS